tara:strand:- start:2803 stop:6240 length:3438 start_codon:yes stop_codon:yes gene_type:complete
MLRHGQTHDVDLWVTAGDIFDHAIYNTGRSGMPELLDAVYRLLDFAPMVAVTGTPTHDVAGSYDVLTRIGDDRFTVIDPRRIYFLNDRGVRSDPADPTIRNDRIIMGVDPIPTPNNDLLIMGMPEPGRAQFMSKATRGRSESDADIKQGMREILTGYGAIRASYPDNPCLFIYHGQVAGASLANGQILPGNGIEIGRDDLALVGADYYALGDIHKGQQIPGMNAYYSGSIFPVDWGETDVKCYNDVTIYGADAGVDIDLIEFGHPPRQKYTVMVDGIPDVIDDIKAYKAAFLSTPPQVWVEIRDRRERMATVDTAAVNLDIKAYAAEGSRVTFSAIPTQTVRSAEIREVKTLYDKIMIRADLSDEPAPDDQAFQAMCERIESEARATGDATVPHRWRLSRAIVQGATGIKKGTGADGIEINFDRDLDPGLVLLRGRTGSGKTSVIENLTPFPRMMTRIGKLQDHFHLADSYRDLYYIDELEGAEYRFFITIAGGPKAGQNTYHIYKWSGSKFVPLEGITGRLDDYNREVIRLFGSFDLYVRSVFLAQSQPKGVPDIATATAGEKKELFSELSGIGHYQRYTDIAKGHATELTTEIEAIENKVEGMKFGIGDKSTVSDKKKAAESERQGVRESQSKEAGYKKTLETETTALRAIVEQNNGHRSTITECNKLITDTGARQSTDIANGRSLQLIQEKAPAAADALAEYEEIKARVEVLANEESAITKSRFTISETYHAATKVVDDEARKYDREITEDRATVRTYETSKADAEKDLGILIERSRRVTCPNCKTEFAIDPESAEVIPGIEDRIEGIVLDIEFIEQRITNREAAKATLEYPTEPIYPTFGLGPELTLRRALLSEYDPVKLQSIITEAVTAGARIEEIDKAVKQADVQMDEWTQRREAADAAIDTDAEDVYTAQAQELKATEVELTRLSTELARLNSDIQHHADRLSEIETLKTKVVELTREIERLSATRAKWAYIQTACGKDGIQALELDALSPAITDTTNNLLQAAYGSRFSIEIRTTKVSGSGSRTKQIEVFNIVVHDSEGDERTLEMLSGGERVWIRKAIYDAFAIVRARSTGLEFATVFLDEADGALDSESTMMYFRMIAAAHEQSKRAHTIVITHSEIAQEIIGQSINMEGFGNAG